MLVALERHREWIALEASSFSLNTSVKDLLNRFLPDTKAYLQQLSHKFSPQSIAIQFTDNRTNLRNLLPGHKYLDLAPLAAFTPEGMNVSYLQYLNALEPAIEHCAKVQTLLSAYSASLAMLLTNPDHRFSTRDGVVSYKKIEEQRASLLKDLAACFQNGSHKTDVRYDDVIERNNDWPLVFEQLAKVTKTANTVDRKLLQRTTEDTAELMDKVIALTHKTDLTKANPNIALELADGAYQVASELEFFASTYYRVLAVTTAIDDTAKSVVKYMAQAKK